MIALDAMDATDAMDAMNDVDLSRRQSVYGLRSSNSAKVPTKKAAKKAAKKAPTKRIKTSINIKLESLILVLSAQ